MTRPRAEDTKPWDNGRLEMWAQEERAEAIAKQDHSQYGGAAGVLRLLRDFYRVEKERDVDFRKVRP